MLQCVNISQYGKYKTILRNEWCKLLILNKIIFIIFSMIRTPPDKKSSFSIANPAGYKYCAWLIKQII